MDPLIYVGIMTLLPLFELRWSIPFGIYMGANWMSVSAVAILANIALGPLVLLGLYRFLDVALKVDFMRNFYEKAVLKTQDKAKAYVEKYGFIGLALFVGVPLPGSGSYTGALAAFLLGVDFKKFALANLVGVLFAGALITAISIGLLG